jgi:hypothetical protein
LFFFLLKTKDEFLGMFYIDLNTADIPYATTEQPFLTKDYSLSKRRLEEFYFFFVI